MDRSTEMQRRHIWPRLSLVLAMFWAGCLGADDHAASAQVNQSITLDADESALIVRIHANVPDAVIEFIAEVGVPSTISISAGESLLPHITAKCGDAGEAYRTLVRQRNPGIVASDFQIAESGQVSLPACARYWRDVALPVAAETSVGDLLESETGFRGPITVSQFLQDNPQIRSSGDPTVIPAGTVVTLRYRNAWTTIELDPAGQLKPDMVRRRLVQLGRPGVSPLVAVNATSSGATLPAVPRGDLQGIETRCPLPVEGQAWPFDSARLLAALERGHGAARRLGREVREGRIAILDNSFIHPPQTPFRYERIAHGEGLPGPFNYFGLNAATRSDPPATDSDYQDADHGVMVATLALGGTHFAAADTGFLGRARIRLYTVVNVVRSRDAAPEPILQEEFVHYAITDAIRNDTYVINASFRFERPMPILSDLIRANPSLLIVAAAGNQPKHVENAGGWPASFGGFSGPFSNQVVTVAASSADMGLADFSTHGSSTVDILAPGCAVPTLGLDQAERQVNGTSFAAPLVAFTAGLLRQFGIHDPARIKERLIVSADVRYDLWHRAWSAGILNPAKAVDLFSDYLAEDGRPEIQHGSFNFASTGVWACSGEPAEPIQGRILKAARLGDAGPWLVIWRTHSGLLKRCLADLSNEFISFRGENDPASRTIPLIRIREMIPAYRFDYQ